jgi:hypothetical protein
MALIAPGAAVLENRLLTTGVRPPQREAKPMSSG